MDTIPFSRFRRDMNGITKKLADNRIEKLLITRRGQPWIAALSPHYYDDNESLIQQRLGQIQPTRNNEKSAS